MTKEYEFIALRAHPGALKIDSKYYPMELPPGCTGVLYSFDTKANAKKFWGDDVKCIKAIKEIIE